MLIQSCMESLYYSSIRHKQVSTETKTEIGDCLLPKLPFTQRWEPLVTAMANPSIKHVFVHSAALYRIRRGNKRREKTFVLQAIPRLSLFPIQSLLLLQACPEVKPPARMASKPCTTDGSGSFHCVDLWSLIVGKWTRGLGCPKGRPPRLIFFKPQKRKGVKKKGEPSKAGGEKGGAIRIVRNIFKVAIWVGWDPSNCLSFFNKSPSPSRRISL